MRFSATLLAVSGLSLALAACGGEAPAPEVPTTPSAVPETPPAPSAVAEAPSATPATPPAPAPKKGAKEILEAGGTFAFSLADSAEAKKVADEACEKKAKKDAKKLEACQKADAEEAAGSGIRFESKDGKLTFVSFVTEKGKEVVLLKSVMKLGKEEAGKIALMPDGKVEGKMAKGPAPKEIAFEVDESTVKMTDPMGKKGVIVYKKK